MPFEFIDSAMLEDLGREARALPRRRLNRNFHPGPDYPCHRLIIALEPDSYIPPHCHREPSKDETLLVLQGRIGAVLFHVDGTIQEARVMGPGTGCHGLTIPHGAIHTLVALEPGSVFFEAKAGPYAAPTPEERPAWAPPEQSPEAVAYFGRLRALF